MSGSDPGMWPRLLELLIDPPPVLLLLLVAAIAVGLARRLERGAFVALATSTVLCLALAEGVSRWAGLGSPSVPVWQETAAEDGPFHYRPNTPLVYSYPDDPRGVFDERNRVVGSINAQGFRGPPARPRAGRETLRVAFLGDSFTLGIGVRDGQTLPASFERVARSHEPPVEALNFGISGSATVEQIELLARYVVTFDPDVVVVVLFLNDPYLKGTMQFVSWPRMLASARQYSAFLDAVVGSIEKIVRHREMVRTYHEGYRPDSSGWKAVRRALREGRDLADERGFELVVALYPALIRLDGGYPFTAIHEIIAEFCRSEGLPFVDLLPAFEGRTDTELWVHPTDQHPNEIAHRLAAEELAAGLRRAGLLQTPDRITE